MPQNIHCFAFAMRNPKWVQKKSSFYENKRLNRIRLQSRQYDSKAFLIQNKKRNFLAILQEYGKFNTLLLSIYDSKHEMARPYPDLCNSQNSKLSLNSYRHLHWAFISESRNYCHALPFNFYHHICGSSCNTVR